MISRSLSAQRGPHPTQYLTCYPTVLAKRKLRTRHTAFLRGELGDLGQRATVKTWADQWLEIRKDKDRPKTYADRQSALKRWIVPVLGTKRLGDLTPGDVRKLTKAIMAAGRTSTTAASIQSVLIKMLRDAMVEGHPVPPRLLEMEAPTVGVSDRGAIPVDQAAALLVTAAAEPDASRWVAALLQGMRQGECLGLTWDLVDFAAGTIDVSWQLQAIPYEHGCWIGTGNSPDPRERHCGRRFGGDCPARRRRIPLGHELRELDPDRSLCLVRPKTEKGQRIIPLIPWMARSLEEWQQAAPPSPYGLVWPEADGSPRRSKADLAAWYALQERAGIKRADRPYLLHEARHSAVTLLLELGVDHGVIKAIVGHSNIVTTRGYQHVDQRQARDALALVGARLGLT